MSIEQICRNLLRRPFLNGRLSIWFQSCLLFPSHAEQGSREVVPCCFYTVSRSACLIIIPPPFISPAASSFSFCRPAVEYRALPEDFKHQLSRRTGGNLTWHDGRGQKTAGGRTVKLLQQPGTEALQVLSTYMTSACRKAHLVHVVIIPLGFLYSWSSGWYVSFCLIKLDDVCHKSRVRKTIYIYFGILIC